MPLGRKNKTARRGKAEPERGLRLGGRSARVRASVLKSTFALLTEKGIDALTIADVAARAGVHETSIYRRWGDKNALVLAACVDYGETMLRIPNTGALRSDLAALVKGVISTLRSPAGQTVLLLGLSQHPHVVAARRTFWTRRFALLQPVFDRAVQRGEFPPDRDPVQFLEALIAPLYFRILVTGEKLEDWPAEEMIGRLLSTY